MKVFFKKDTFVRGVPVKSGTVMDVSDANDLYLLNEGRKVEPFDAAKHTKTSQKGAQ